MLIYLMRHGETEWNKERRFQGQIDIPLNENGVELAVKTAEGLKDVAFDAVFSSPLKRAFLTAQTVVGDRNVEVVPDERLQELYFGPSEGEHFEPAKKNPEHPMYTFLCEPGRYFPTDGAEAFDRVRARTAEFLQEKILPLEGSCENVLIVAHGAVNRIMLNRIANIPDENFWQIGLPNCAVSIISLEKGVFRILEESKVYYGTPLNVRP